MKSEVRIQRLKYDVMRRGGSFICNPDTSERDFTYRSISHDGFMRKGAFVWGGNPFERDVAIYHAWRVSDEQSVVQVRARFLYELVKLATIEIYPDWTLAGEHLSHWFGFLEMEREPENANKLERIKELGVKDDEIEAIRKTVEDWQIRNWSGEIYPYVDVGVRDEENIRGVGRWGKIDVCLASGWVENHSVRDYCKVLRIGFNGIRREIESELDSMDISDADYVRKENFLKAARWICDAGVLLGKRYAELAETRGLKEMSVVCRKVPAEGAETFFEAVQSLWFAHILTCGEDSINANSIGRLDQILYPYYKKDIESGRLTRAEAVEIMEELACKLYLDYDVQAIMLGGVDRDGNCAVNELSYVILDSTERVDFIRDIAVRVNKETDGEFFDKCAELIVKGGGIPFVFNDDCFIQALVDRGISIEDARDYVHIGCVELTIPGKANPHAVSGWFSAIKCLELALFDGYDPVTDRQVGPKTGLLSDFSGFEEFREAFVKQMEFFARRMVYNINRGELLQRERGPLPCWSSLTDDCIKRGRDITNGGAVYNYHSICFMGAPNVADSLYALKEFVFEGRRVDKGELLDALRANFEGYESLRAQLLNLPKYGNNISEVDEYAIWVSNYFIDLMDKYRTPLNGRYFVHLFTFQLNIDFGRTLGATPDGRFKGEPIAYSLSPQQGRDEKGLASVLGTLKHLPHNKAAGGSAAIIDVDPAMVEGDAGVKRLSQIIQGAIKSGVGQMQWNVTTAERLRLAQCQPEKYGNIPVRVAGYSQMFKLLSEELQEHIIARTKHKE